MKTGRILLLGVFAVGICGCAHTGPQRPRNETPPAAASLNDSDAKSLKLLQAADMARASGDLLGATKLYAEAVNLQPANSMAWFGLGTNYLRQNNIDLAVVALQEAVRRDPAMQKAWSNLALAHLEQFRTAARNALSGTQVTAANRDALASMLADAERTLAPVPNSTPLGH